MHSSPAEDGHNIVQVYNATDDHSTLGLCLPHLFEYAAKTYNQKTALICGNETLSFVELNSFANRFARVLARRGIGNGVLVGVVLDRSVELVAVLLAVLKTGAAYVPIDPAFPAQRINQMLEDAHPKVLITGGDSTEELAPLGIECLSIDEVLHLINSECDSSNLDIAIQSDSLMYIMYTSGSTGRPKGVEISHGSVSNLLLSMQKEPGCGETDRLLAITTVSFDMAVLELFLPLLCGATTVIAQRLEVKDPAALIRIMEHSGITIMQGTPAIWQMLLEAGWQGRLNQIFCGGEALSRQLANRLMDRADAVWNMYGPTEATVYGSIWKVRKDHDIMIGGPITNGRLYVLDENQSPVPLGSSGELYIGGAGVARGYHNNSDLTSSRFLDNPFHDGRMYRTGDLAQWSEPGSLSVIGRMDGQVKIRGYRIELGDIEATIAENQNISSTVVVCHDDRLVAYYVQKQSVHKDGTSDTISFDRVLRDWLTKRLPVYMVPAFFVKLEAFPVTLNGKIDRKALPDPTVKVQSMPDKKSDTELQGQILAVWQKVLGHNNVGVEDSFFEVGGDSVRLIRVQKELEKLLGRLVPAPKLFEHYTVKRLAAYMSSSPGIAVANPVLEQTHANISEDIAIISVACRLPGGITTPEEFWELLERGGDAITDVPMDRWDADALYHLSPEAQGKTYCRRGGFISTPTSFDISFFGISPREARTLDPSQYLMMETCWEGFERAGYNLEKLRGSQTGVYIGTSSILAHQHFNRTAVQDLADLDGYAGTGSAAGTMSGRISYHLGLEGPAMTIDTACSSSLVTTHLACTALRQGECDLAVSGGISLMLNPGLHVEFSRLQGMSQDGRCRSFSADSQGTGWAEGSVVTILKRLSDAQRDGDFIQGIIRGTAVNHDGRSASLTTPSGPAQQKLVHRALAAARLEPNDIDYVEAHGTATKLGDPIEAMALAEVFGPSRNVAEPLQIGSAKSNIGHTQAAAGLAGLLKVILALQHETIPQTLHVIKPTPEVDWQTANMTPVLSKRPWTKGIRLRRAGVSAFGIGGTNAHVIVEEPPKRPAHSDDGSRAVRLPDMLPFTLSGDTEAALRMQADKLYRQLSSTTDLENLGNLAYSLATSRSHFRKRTVLEAEGKAELLEKLTSTRHQESFSSPDGAATGMSRLAMLFTGQGSQWLGMGKDLCKVYPTFRETIIEVAAEFTQLDFPLLDVMWAEPGSILATLLDRTDFAQPALFALEVALWRQWQEWGVKPEVVLGHSLGELVAAHVSGILDLRDACRLVAARGRLMQAQFGDNKMVSLGASAAEIELAVKQLGYSGNVDIAAYNTPTQTVISGDTKVVESITKHFTGLGRKNKTVLVGHAFHSRQMDGILTDFRSVAETVRYNPPNLKIMSGLDGRLAKEGQLEQADYWVNQVREPVRFCDSIQELTRHGINTFLELGPRPVLCGMGVTCLADDENGASVAWLASLKPHKDNTLVLQRSLIDLHLRHVRIDWQAYFKPFGCQRVELPTYAFQREYMVQLSTPPGVASPSSKGVDSPISNSDIINVRDGAHGCSQFGIEWHPAKVDDIHHSGIWGVLRTDENRTSTWASLVLTAISQTGIRLVEVEYLEEAEKLNGVICLWDSAKDVLLQPQDFMAKALTQLQTAVRTQFIPPLVWITSHVVGTGMESVDCHMRLGVAPLWGLMRTARNEHPELNIRLVDLDEQIGPYIASALMLNDEPECALRHDRVLVPRMQKIDTFLKSSTKQRLIRKDGAVIITGGLGHLGTRVAWWLATVHNVRDLILTSRRGMKAPGADKFVAELSGLGTRVTVISSDIADPDSIESIKGLFSEKRPLRGVIHAAGVSHSGVLSALTPEQCATTLAPKVYGAWLLHQMTQDMDLDIFVLFSSISGVMGMPGLANYAAANTFLDALAHLRHGQHLPATSVAYGVWAGDGMGSKLSGTTRTHLSHFGLDALSGEEGLAVLEQASVNTRALTVAAVLDLGRLQSYYEEQGGIPPLLRSLISENKTQASRGWAMTKALSTVEPEQHESNVLNMVREVVAKALGFVQPLDVDVDRPLQDIGIDSLTAVQIRNHLATLTGLTISVNIVFLYPNLRALSELLLSQLQLKNALSSSTTTASDTETPASSVSGFPRLDLKVIRKGCLDRSLCFDNVAQYPIKYDKRPDCVLLTGATGFVGAFILFELLRKGITTYCLVRANSVEQARQRVASTLRHYGLWAPEFMSKIKPTVGDMAQPLLGLTEELFDDLADRVDTICHSGGLVDWMRPLEDYVGPNIVSTHELLRLASRGCAKSVHLVSTMSTLPKHMGMDLTEEDVEYGYGTSKYISERLVAAARWRGAKASVYRLPYVTASTETGHFRLDRGDFLHNLITGGLEMGAFPSLDADMSAVLPVDYLSKTIVTAMTQDLHRIGRDYDFSRSCAPTSHEFFEMVGAVSGGKEMIPFGTWKQRALDYAGKFPRSPLARISAVLDNYTDENAATMFKPGLTIGEYVFGGKDYPAPSIDEQSIRAYIKRIKVGVESC